jgi:hypothetical protein
MKIPIPKQTQIAGHKIQVRVVNIHPSEEAQGMTLVDKLRIFLDKSLSETQLEEVYLHELIELSLALREFKVDHHIIQSLALDLHQALKSGK